MPEKRLERTRLFYSPEVGKQMMESMKTFFVPPIKVQIALKNMQGVTEHYINPIPPATEGSE